jgi:hypothetical protein
VTSLGAPIAEQKLSFIAIRLADHTSLNVVVLGVVVDGKIVRVGDLHLVFDGIGQDGGS